MIQFDGKNMFKYLSNQPPPPTELPTVLEFLHHSDTCLFFLLAIEYLKLVLLSPCGTRVEGILSALLKELFCRAFYWILY